MGRGVGRAFATVAPNAVTKAATRTHHSVVATGGKQKQLYANRIVIPDASKAKLHNRGSGIFNGKKAGGQDKVHAYATTIGHVHPADANGDGVVSEEEMMAYATPLRLFPLQHATTYHTRTCTRSQDAYAVKVSTQASHGPGT